MGVLARRRLASVLVLVAVWLMLWCVWCAPALAHARLLEAEPPAGANLKGSPEQVRLRFSEPVEAAFDPIKVFDPAGERVDEKTARVTPEDVRIVETDLKDLPEGTYRVQWRVASVDGHVVADTYRFTATAADSANANSRGDKAARQPQERPVDEQKPVAREEGAAGGANSVAVYTAVSLGIVGLAVLALLAANALRRRKTRP